MGSNPEEMALSSSLQGSSSYPSLSYGGSTVVESCCENCWLKLAEIPFYLYFTAKLFDIMISYETRKFQTGENNLPKPRIARPFGKWFGRRRVETRGSPFHQYMIAMVLSWRMILTRLRLWMITLQTLEYSLRRSLSTILAPWLISPSRHYIEWHLPEAKLSCLKSKSS